MKLRNFLFASCALFASCLIGCTTNKATGESNLNWVDEKQEVAIGLQAEPEFLKNGGGELPDAHINQYVSDLGLKLAAVSERPQLEWKFHVLNSDVINAFALPGGKIFITRALLSRMTNEAQLAGVLGHEVGHVTAEHIGQQMSRSQVVQGAVAAIGMANKVSDKEWIGYLGTGADGAGHLYLLKFGRDQETQADELGVRYMTRMGYSPIAQVQVMQILDAVSKDNTQMEILSTHPQPASRIEDLQALISKSYPNANAPGAYKFNEDQFKANVLVPLAKLPPAPPPAPAPK